MCGLKQTLGAVLGKKVWGEEMWRVLERWACLHKGTVFSPLLKC